MAELYAKNAGQWVKVGGGGNESASIKIKRCNSYEEFYNFIMSLEIGTVIISMAIPGRFGRLGRMNDIAMVVEKSSISAKIFTNFVYQGNSRVTSMDVKQTGADVEESFTTFNKSYTMDDNMIKESTGIVIYYIE